MIINMATAMRMSINMTAIMSTGMVTPVLSLMPSRELTSPFWMTLKLESCFIMSPQYSLSLAKQPGETPASW